MVSHMQIAAEVTEPACPESDIYNALLSLDDCNIVELGCGAAELTRDIATGGRNRSILALEVDESSATSTISKNVSYRRRIRIINCPRTCIEKFKNALPAG